MDEETKEPIRHIDLETGVITLNGIDSFEKDYDIIGRLWWKRKIYKLVVYWPVTGQGKWSEFFIEYDDEASRDRNYQKLVAAVVGPQVSA